MKKLLTGLLAIISYNSFAQVGAGANLNSFINIVNNTESDMLAYSMNSSNNFMFRCLIQVPKKYQEIKSPAFKNQMVKLSGDAFPVQTFVIEKNSSVQFQLNDVCDSDDVADLFAITTDAKLNMKNTVSSVVISHIYSTPKDINASLTMQGEHMTGLLGKWIDAQHKAFTVVITNKIK